MGNIQTQFEIKKVTLNEEYIAKNLEKIIYLDIYEWEDDGMWDCIGVDALMEENGKIVSLKRQAYDSNSSDEYETLKTIGKFMQSEKVREKFNVISSYASVRCFNKDVKFEIKNGGCLISPKKLSKSDFCAFSVSVNDFCYGAMLGISWELEELVKKFIKKEEFGKLTDDEKAFVRALIVEPDYKDWLTAVRYIRYINGEIFNFSPESEEEGLDALWRFRLQYVKEKVTNEKLAKLSNGEESEKDILEEFIQECFGEDGEWTGNLIDILSEKLHEDLRKVFSKTEIIKYNDFKLEINESMEPMENLFVCPKLIDFSDEDDERIIEQILKMDYDKIRNAAAEIYCYLSNYLEFYETKAYAKILPVAFHIIEVGNIPYSNRYADLFWMASEVINEYWKMLPEDEKIQAELRERIYKAYWPKVGDMWPIKNCHRFWFENEAEQRVFREALGWVLCLDDICEHNKELGKYLKDLSKSKEFLEEKADLDFMTIMRVFKMMMQDKDDDAWFEMGSSGYRGEMQVRILAYPDTFKKAKSVIKEGFNDDYLLEQLVITGNSKELGGKIIRYIAYNLPEDYPYEKAILIFTAACTGASNEDELEALREFGEELRNSKLKGKTMKLARKIDKGLKLAEKNIKAIKFQQERI